MYKVTVPIMLKKDRFQKEKVLSELKRSKSDRIALALESRSAKEETVLLSKLIPYFKENGIEVLVWLGETLGHNAGKPDPDSPYHHMRFFDQGDIGAVCPLDEAFREELCRWIKEVASLGADMIMLDDDFRVGYRGGLGCCCKLHMEKIQKELGEKITEEELKNRAFCGGKNRYRDAWLKVQGDALRSFAKKMRDALDTVNPDARLGLCSAPASWDSEGTSTLELAEIMAGKTRPFLRSTGAPYWVPLWKDGKTIGDVVEYERMQAYWCKDSEAEVFTEGDTFPRPRNECSAAELECFDLLLRAVGGTDGILKYMLDYVAPADYESGYFDFQADHQKLYKEVERIFGDKSAVGVRPFCHRQLMQEKEMDPKDPDLMMNIQKDLYQPEIHFAVRNSLPISYEPGGVNLIFGEQARYVTEDDLKYGSILDSTAAGILMERGIDVGIEGMEKGNGHQQRFFSDMPVEYDIKEKVDTLLWPVEKLYDMVLKPGAVPVTQIRSNGRAVCGAFHYENGDGFRFLVYAFDAKCADGVVGWFHKPARKRQVERSITWLQKKEPEVYSIGNHPFLYLLEKKNETGIAVAVCNLFPDKIKNTRICVNAEYQDIEFVNCTGHAEGKEIVLDTVLYPYEFAAFEVTF